MSECRDHRFEEMLPRYELNLLSEADTAAFEEHLYTCESCFTKVREFQDAAQALRFDPKVRETVATLASQTEEDRSILVRLMNMWVVMPRLAKLAAVVLPVVVILLSIPWRLELHRTDEAIATHPRVGIAVIENLAVTKDTLNVARITERLLSIALAESGRLSVLAPQLVNRNAVTLDVALRKIDDKRPLLELAAAIQADFLVIVSILQVEPRLTMATMVLDVKNRQLSESERLDGAPGESVFSTVNRLTRLIGRGLTIPDSLMATGKSVADLTTHSFAAYQQYLRGLEFRKRHSYDSARASFEKAIANDSSFAMAYYYLWFYAPDNTCERLLQQALDHSEQSDVRSRFFIRSHAYRMDRKWGEAIRELEGVLELYPDDVEALIGIGSLERIMGRFETSVEHLQRAVQVDSLNSDGYNELATTLSVLGRYAEALGVIDKSIDREPENANLVDSKGDILAQLGMWDSARVVFGKALVIDSAITPARYHLIQLHLLMGYPDSALDHITYLRRYGPLNYPSLAAYLEAVAAVRAGRFRDALRLADDGIARDQENDLLGLKLRKLFLKATVLLEIDSLDEALAILDRCDMIGRTIRPDDKLGYNTYRAQFLARAGRLNEAAEIAERIRLDITDSAAAEFGSNFATGFVAMAQSDWTRAAACFERALAKDPRSFVVPFWLARAELAAGITEKAASRIEQLHSRFDAERLRLSTLDIMSHYYLGQAYEQTGRKRDAGQQYRIFLQAWSEADYPLAAISDAQARLERLNQLP